MTVPVLPVVIAHAGNRVGGRQILGLSPAKRNDGRAGGLHEPLAAGSRRGARTADHWEPHGRTGADPPRQTQRPDRAASFLRAALTSAPYRVFCKNTTCMLGVICRDRATPRPVRWASPATVRLRRIGLHDLDAVRLGSVPDGLDQRYCLRRAKAHHQFGWLPVRAGRHASAPDSIQHGPARAGSDIRPIEPPQASASSSLAIPGINTPRPE